MGHGRESKASLRERARPFGADLLFFVFAMVLIVTWVVATPRWAVPDETVHVFKAFGTAHRQLLGHEIVTDPPTPSNFRRFDGPIELGVGDLRCYFYKPNVPAGCDVGADPNLVSSAARYPPYYYALVGGGARLVGESTNVHAYRVASALLCSVGLVIAFALIRRSKSRRLTPLILVTLTPMALYMMCSVNPNATEIAGFIMIWAMVVRLCTDDELSKNMTLAMSATAAALVLSRPISAVWLVCLAAVVMIAVDPQRRREFFRWPYLVRLVVPLAISVLASIVWLNYAKFEVGNEQVASAMPLGEVLRFSIEQWPEYYRQTIGVLGWLDTRLPTVTYVGWSVALALVAAIHLIRSTARNWLTLAALVAAWLVLPLAINAFTAADAGLTFQGRYSLPILAGLVFLPMLDVRHRQWIAPTNTLMYAALAFVSIAEVAGFWQMLRRFSVGANGKIWLSGDLGWSPGVPPMLLVVLNAMMMIALCVAMVAVCRSKESLHPKSSHDVAEDIDHEVS